MILGTITKGSSTKDIGIQCNIADADITTSIDDNISDDSDMADSYSDPSDSDYINSNFEDLSSTCEDNPAKNAIPGTKYIVFETALLSLFSTCYQCHSSSVSITKLVIGSFIHITQTCEACESTNSWDSQAFIKDIPAGNILISSSILFSGCLPEKSIRFLRNFKCATISNRIFYSHQKSYLLPSVFYIWDKHQQALITHLVSEGKLLVLGGDGRADSPGHCAKYSTYSMIELTHNVVLDVQVVQVKVYISFVLFHTK